MTANNDNDGREGIVLYKSRDGTVTLDVKLDPETVWLSLNQLAALFERDKSVISRHLRNVFKEGELDRASTVAKNATVQTEGEFSRGTDPNGTAPRGRGLALPPPPRLRRTRRALHMGMCSRRFASRTPLRGLSSRHFVMSGHKKTPRFVGAAIIS
jgi:hypothetical protein